MILDVTTLSAASVTTAEAPTVETMSTNFTTDLPGLTEEDPRLNAPQKHFRIFFYVGVF